MDIAKIFTLIGGLGLFFYGMQTMSNGIEKAAGAKLRDILEAITKNRFMGFLVGVFVTAVIQSSGATTVMVVSFVNSGLMSLYQASGIILGANVGTTITTQLVAFDLDMVAPLILFVGVVMVMFFHDQKVKKAGEIVLGFGMLFVGMSLMKDSMGTLKDSETMLEFFRTLRNPLVSIIFGFIITALSQSSSVTVSIILVMASQGMIELPVCLFAILGCNIGSCTTALLASMSGRKDAKRAALIHFLFNVGGSIVLAVIFLIAGSQIADVIMQISGNEAGRAVANAHLSIKLFQVIIMFPFTNQLVKLTYVLIRGEDEKAEGFALKYIGDNTVFSPATAVVEAIKELERMGNIASNNMNRAMNCLMTLDEEDMQEVHTVETNINMMSESITGYLVRINQLTLPIDDKKSIGSLFHVVSEIERIGNHAETMAEAAEQRAEQNISFSKVCINEMSVLLDMVNTIITYSMDMFSNNNSEHLTEIIELKEKITRTEKKFQENHIERLTTNMCEANAGTIYSDVLTSLERVADHATNVAYSILEDDERKNLRVRAVEVAQE